MQLRSVVQGTLAILALAAATVIYVPAQEPGTKPEIPSAPGASSGPKFPPVDPKNFTATAPTRETVEAFLHVELLLNLFERRGAGINREGDADFAGEVAAVLIGVGDDDVARASVASDGGSHDADGAGSGDEDVFAEDGECERGMDGVAEGIEDRGDLVGDAWRVAPDVGHGDDDVLGEGSVAINADSKGVGAEVATACEAVAASSADNVAFAAD